VVSSESRYLPNVEEQAIIQRIRIESFYRSWTGKSYKTEGYIAIVMPKIEEADTMMDKLMSPDSFKEYFTKHNTPSSCENGDTTQELQSQSSI